MATSSTTKKSTLAVKAQQRIAGLQADKFGGNSSLTIEGTGYTVASATTRLQSIVTTIDTADTTGTAHTQAVAKKKAAAPADSAFIKSFDAAMLQAVGPDAEVLSQYGIELAQPKAKPSAATQISANQKRATTRKARGIMGPKQRAALTNPEPTVVVVGSAPAPADNAAPASAAPALAAAPTPAAGNAGH